MGGIHTRRTKGGEQSGQRTVIDERCGIWTWRAIWQIATEPVEGSKEAQR